MDLKTAAEAVALLKNGYEVAKGTTEKLHNLWKNTTDRQAKAEIQDIIDELSELKKLIAKSQDTIRDLGEKLRFKSDEYEFRNPFRYHKGHPDRPLCTKCFAKEVEGPMSEERHDLARPYRRCLVCGNPENLTHEAPKKTNIDLSRRYT